MRDVRALHAPAFALLEVANVLCKKIRRGELSRGRAEGILQELEGPLLRLHGDGDLRSLGFALTNHTGRSLYDGLYLALAITIDGKFATADRKLFDGLPNGPHAGHIRWVEDLP